MMIPGVIMTRYSPVRSRNSNCRLARPPVKKGVGRYIVSTTKMWGKPLQKADFTLRVSRCITMTFWAFQTDSLTSTRDTTKYHSHFDFFMPDGEMDVRWQ